MMWALILACGLVGAVLAAVCATSREDQPLVRTGSALGVFVLLVVATGLGAH